MRTKE
jgi:hypothetical protein